MVIAVEAPLPADRSEGFVHPSRNLVEWNGESDDIETTLLTFADRLRNDHGDTSAAVLRRTDTHKDASEPSHILVFGRDENTIRAVGVIPSGQANDGKRKLAYSLGEAWEMVTRHHDEIDHHVGLHVRDAMWLAAPVGGFTVKEVHNGKVKAAHFVPVDQALQGGEFFQPVVK